MALLPELALGLYLYIVAGLAFILTVLLLETYRSLVRIYRRAKREARLDPVALQWLRRIEDPGYDPSRHGDEF